MHHTGKKESKKEIEKKKKKKCYEKFALRDSTPGPQNQL